MVPWGGLYAVGYFVGGVGVALGLGLEVKEIEAPAIFMAAFVMVFFSVLSYWALSWQSTRESDPQHDYWQRALPGLLCTVSGSALGLLILQIL